MTVKGNMISLAQALIALRAWSQWYLVVSMDSKYFPGFKILQKAFGTALKSLRSESRRAVMRLILHQKCLMCEVPVKLGIGDHVIPLSEITYHSVENYIPLCKRCNSSKGRKDLLEWWIGKGRHISELHPDALTVYLRLRFRFASPTDLDSPSPEYLVIALKQAESTLPPKLLNFWQTTVYGKHGILHDSQPTFTEYSGEEYK